MVRFKINGVEYEVCNEWHEVDPDKLMVTETFKEELEALSTIPKELIEKVDDMQLFPFYTVISFLDDLETIQALKAVTIEDESYEKMELLKQRVIHGKPYRKCLKAGRVYYPDEKNAVRLISLGASIIAQLEIFLNAYKELGEHEPDNDEIIAGVDTLTAFGAWGTAYSLAGRDVLKLRAVLEMKAITVYEALRYNQRETKYMKRLHEIKYPRKP